MPLMDNTVRAGNYRKRITIQVDRSTTTDENGRPIPKMMPFAQAWARVSRLTGRELELSLQIASEATDIVEMRYLYGITDEMQVVFPQPDGSSRILEINAAIDPEERHIKTYLLCHDAPEEEVS